MDKTEALKSPVPDSSQAEPFESIVELYYQAKGYITSSNKWFWSWEKEKKKQRGWRDIDVLAVNNEETLIVAVTVNLHDKVGSKRNKDNLRDYFRRVEDYLKHVKEYRWLTQSPR